MSFIIGQPGGAGGGGSDIPQVKGTCINWLPDGQGLLTAGVNQTSTRIKGIPFPVKGNIDCLGVNLQVQNISTATLHLAIYKYDYTNDICRSARYKHYSNRSNPTDIQHSSIFGSRILLCCI
jgi:hypothetical protein